MGQKMRQSAGAWNQEQYQHSGRKGRNDQNTHLAYAEATADILITCDDKFLKKCRKETNAIEVLTPVEFVSRKDLI